MLITRLFWFSIGYAATSASISQFVSRDLSARRLAVLMMEFQFSDLENRILNLKSVRNRSSIRSAEAKD